MADNTTLNAGTGGDVIATDDIGGVKFQRVKVTFGADGSATDASSTNPLPVSGNVGVTGPVAVTGTFYQATQPVSLASVPLPTGAATAAKQAAPGVAGTPSADVLTIQGASAMTALKVDGSATTQPVSASSLPLPAGAATAAAQAANTAAINALTGTQYKTVVASVTGQLLGATGAIGDLLSTLLVVPASTSPGAITIQDGSGTAITVFAGGSTSVSNLVPFAIPIGAKATGAGWKVTTGANVSVIATGNFT